MSPVAWMVRTRDVRAEAPDYPDCELLPLCDDFRPSVTDCVRVLGADHPGTRISRNNPAYGYREAGDLKRAIPLYEETPADCMRMLGADHPLTQVVRENLEAAWGRVKSFPVPQVGVLN